MKMRLVVVCLLCVLMFSSCQGKNSRDGGGASQELSDGTCAARKFAETLFAKHMEESGVSEYEIEQTSCGARTDSQPRFFVEFAYQAEGESRTYAYLISVGDDRKCSLLKESGEIPAYDLLLSEE